MLRLRFVGNAAAMITAATVMSTGLAGCSGSSMSMPDWLSFNKSPPPMQTLQFESDPAGADVRTVQGQTCQTPCSLAVAPQSQVVTFSKNGYQPQTVQVVAGDPPDHSLFESPPPTLTPNPVEAALQPNTPPRKTAVKPRPPRHAAVSNTGTMPPPPGQASSPFPPGQQ
jgi:PEGA domain